MRPSVILLAFIAAMMSTSAYAQTPPEQSAPVGQSTSPLSIHVGDTDLLLGGFMDATVISRDTYTSNGIGTSFGTVPFSNTPQGNLDETRLSAQNSRITLQATSRVGTANLKGYIEADFLGNAPSGLNVTSNSNTLRMRLYWAQYRQGKFEFLAGQSWSMLTPNRNGLSPTPSDIFFTQNMDTNYQMGLTWARATQLRFVVHASDVVTTGVSLENPQQYVGSAVVLPAAFPAGEVDTGTMTTNAPSSYPDIVGKIAFDPKVSSRHQHFDVAVLVRGYRTYDPATNASFTKTGTGGEMNAVVEPIKNVRIVANAFLGSGGGRYIANTNVPDLVVNGDASLSLVKSRSYMVGSEFQIGSKTLACAYYSEVHADQALATDTNGKVIGFGVAGSTAANRDISEPTIGITQTLFRDPRVGGIQVMVQYSRVQRTPFSVPAGTPTDAKTNMLYVNVRYLLP